MLFGNLFYLNEDLNFSRYFQKIYPKKYIFLYLYFGYLAKSITGKCSKDMELK